MSPKDVLEKLEAVGIRIETNNPDAEEFATLLKSIAEHAKSLDGLKKDMTSQRETIELSYVPKLIDAMFHEDTFPVLKLLSANMLFTRESLKLISICSEDDHFKRMFSKGMQSFAVHNISDIMKCVLPLHTRSRKEEFIELAGDLTNELETMQEQFRSKFEGHMELFDRTVKETLTGHKEATQ